LAGLSAADAATGCVYTILVRQGQRLVEARFCSSSARSGNEAGAIEFIAPARGPVAQGPRPDARKEQIALD